MGICNPKRFKYIVIVSAMHTILFSLYLKFSFKNIIMGIIMNFIIMSNKNRIVLVKHTGRIQPMYFATNPRGIKRTVMGVNTSPLPTCKH